MSVPPFKPRCRSASRSATGSTNCSHAFPLAKCLSRAASEDYLERRARRLLLWFERSAVASWEPVPRRHTPLAAIATQIASTRLLCSTEFEALTAVSQGCCRAFGRSEVLVPLLRSAVRGFEEARGLLMEADSRWQNLQAIVEDAQCRLRGLPKADLMSLKAEVARACSSSAKQALHPVATPDFGGTRLVLELASSVLQPGEQAHDNFALQKLVQDARVASKASSFRPDDMHPTRKRNFLKKIADSKRRDALTRAATQGRSITGSASVVGALASWLLSLEAELEETPLVCEMHLARQAVLLFVTPLSRWAVRPHGRAAFLGRPSPPPDPEGEGMAFAARPLWQLVKSAPRPRSLKRDSAKTTASKVPVAQAVSLSTSSDLESSQPSVVEEVVDHDMPRASPWWLGAASRPRPPPQAKTCPREEQPASKAASQVGYPVGAAMDTWLNPEVACASMAHAIPSAARMAAARHEQPDLFLSDRWPMATAAALATATAASSAILADKKARGSFSNTSIASTAEGPGDRDEQESAPSSHQTSSRLSSSRPSLQYEDSPIPSVAQTSTCSSGCVSTPPVQCATIVDFDVPRLSCGPPALGGGGASGGGPRSLAAPSLGGAVSDSSHSRGRPEAPGCVGIAGVQPSLGVGLAGAFDFSSGGYGASQAAAPATPGAGTVLDSSWCSPFDASDTNRLLEVSASLSSRCDSEIEFEFAPELDGRCSGPPRLS